MAEALVLFGVQKLWDLLNQEYEQFQGLDDQVTELKRDLNLLSSFMKDADAKKHKSAVARNCVEEIKEIIYDAEDIIETFLLKEELGKKSGFIKRVRRFAFPKVNRKEHASDIGGISKRISKVIQDMQSFGIQQMIEDSRYTQLLHDRQSEMRQTFSMDDERNLVGLEENINKMVGLMVEEENVQVVSITRMGGLGKTTLARQVFNHNLVRNKYDGFAWVCVSQEFTRKSVWQTILRSLRPKNVEEHKIVEMTESTLQGELFQLLETSKSFIVLDDIWKEEDWDLIKPIFPPEKGWKVLLTSRNESVTIRGDTTYVNFKPECLTIQDSWVLFQRIAFPRKYAPEFKADEGMEEMGKQMIKHCGGLPLAVKVLGGLLAAKYTLHDWKRFYENIRSHIMGRTKFNDSNNSSVYNVLSMSFEELPSYLKHCFLYLAHFPEDHKINIERLSYYWAAEGISELRNYNGETIREVGDSYIEELVRRNMVISERDVKTLRLETCHLHDMMREICLFKAKEENFLHISGIGSLIGDSQSPFRSRRFVSPYPTSLDVGRYRNNPKLRSLVFVRCNLWKESWKLSGSSFKRLQLLRVLDLYAAKFRGGKLPSSIGSLIHLRYLSLKDAEVSQLPASLGNLMLLIYLNLNLSTWKSVFVPNVVMQMQELRYLALPMRMYKKTKLELSNLVNLETLKNFSTMNSSLEDLCGMVRLRILSINLSEEASIESLSASINGLRHLEDLDIHDHIFDRKMEDRIVLDFIHLKHLKLDIYMPRVPDEQHFPSHLTTISLSGCRWDEDPMSILEKLFQLKEVSLRYKSFCGKRMVCSSGGFPQLQKLHLYALMEWEEWIVEEGSMPLLHTLRIRNCRELKQLPDGLRFITSLKELEMNSARLEFKEKLSRGGEEFYKVQHIPFVRIQLVRRPIPSEANISSVGL